MRHEIRRLVTPIAVLVKCSCGWSREITRKQNALARARKVEKAIDDHFADAHNIKIRLRTKETP